MALNQRALAELGALSELTRLSTELLALVAEFPALHPTAVATLRSLTSAARPPKAKTNGAAPGPTSGLAGPLHPKKPRTVSAAARRKMSLHMKRRWKQAKAAGQGTLKPGAAAK